MNILTLVLFAKLFGAPEDSYAQEGGKRLQKWIGVDFFSTYGSGPDKGIPYAKDIPDKAKTTRDNFHHSDINPEK